MSNALGKYAGSQKAAKVATPQTKRTPGRTDEVKNNAGGFVFKVDDKSRLERFLILGTDKGTYYVGEQKLTAQNVSFLKNLVQKDERLVVDTLVDVSVNGRALKNSPALFALATVMTEGKDKAYAREAVQKVARTSTHLFEYAQYIDDLGGWGRAKRRSVAEWYENKSLDTLAYQAVKYRQRNGWTHRDLFRLSHPQGVDQGVGNFILGKDVESEVEILKGFAEMQSATSVKDVIKTLETFKNLPWETIPTQFLKDVKVWKTLFYNGQLRGQALIRNITRLARIGAFDDMVFATDYANAIANQEMIQKTRLHPINFLNAVVVHEYGQIDRNGYSMWSAGRKKDWKSNGKIVDALNEGFHMAFKAVEPSGKRTLVATDVSGSMSQSAIGLDLSCAQVSAAVAMTVARTEPYSDIVGFSSSIVDLGITAKSSFADAMRKVSNRNFGGTDAAAAIKYADQKGIQVDTFVVITDNETWGGSQKPFQALKQYRQKTGIDARLAVLGVASTDFSIADPTDRGMMDFVGFDANAPRALADFSAGRI
ncbi:Ro-like RNA binding protein [Streptomyces phage Stigma]|uniref:Ro-like RNA binding protein n=1 Tax=Streptomyces phage Belfort TaxID=2801887 RepID=A0A7T8C414_9CAUD|nr:Ro-like RNA binding protein [Streptomyces phage Belfort]UTN92351.1 Ro-like RNA binding protein [Streptomyces phage Stigma]